MRIGGVLTDWRLIADVLKENVKSLQKLNTDVAAIFLAKISKEESEHILLQEETETQNHIHVLVNNLEEHFRIKEMICKSYN